MKIKLLALICAFAMVGCMLIGCAGSFTNPQDSRVSKDSVPNEEGAEEEKQEKEKTGAVSYVSIDINPQISLTVDEEELVTAVLAENEDAQVLLYGEEDLVGMELDVAVEKITALAVELGYLNEENKVVDVMVSSENDEVVAEIQEKIDSKVKKIAKDKNMDIEVSNQGAYSLICDLEELKEQYPEIEEIQKLTPAKFKLAKSVYEMGELDLKEAVKMDEHALINRVKNAYNRIDKFATKEYEKLISEANGTYDEAVKEALASIYAKFYEENGVKYGTTFYYGSLYQLYATTQKSFSHLAQKLLREAEIENEALTDEQAEQIKEALGVDSIEELFNKKGEITIESVKEFADKKIKNSPKGEELDRLKDGFKDSLNRIEEQVEERVDRENQDCSKELAEIQALVTLTVKTVESMCNMLPEETKSELETYINEYKSIVEAALTEEITAEKAQEIANTMEAKAKEIRKKIEESLSKEDVDRIENAKEEIEEGLTEEKEELERKLQKAKEEAHKQLAEAKNNRKYSHNR